MAANIDLLAYSDALLVLGTAGVIVPVVHRWRVSPVLGFLAAGAVLGPLGLGSFKDTFPFLQWLTVTDAKNIAGIADLGVVFLLFLIGLELSLERLLTMRRLVFGLGSLQVVLTGLVIGAIATLFGNKADAAIIIGLSLALSSTAIVIELLAHQRRLMTSAGRASFAILLFQDLAIVPMLLLVSILGAQTGQSVFLGMALTLFQAAVVVALIVAVGRLLLRPFFHLVAATDSAELFVAATLFVIVGTGVASAVAGLSMALGAFVAGLILAESEFRKAIETTIEPFKGLLLGLFFFTVGMGVDFREIAREPLWLFASVVGLIGIKALLATGLCRLFGLTWPAAVETGLLLGPGGEFAFVGIGMAVTVGIIATEPSRFFLAVTSLTMALTPLLSMVARRVAARIEKRKPLAPELTAAPPADGKGHAIVVGHGRVGQIVCAMLDHHKFPYISTDRDSAAVTEWRRRGREVYYGDAANLAFLKSCGLLHASAVIVTIHTRDAIDEIVRVVREVRPDILIVSRARDASHARHLYAIGVTDAVPETIEASLQLSEATLVGLGLPTGPVIASIHDKRDEFRNELQEAADKAGLTETHAIRSKTLRSS
ncbi:MAG: potassium transporter TrkA [Hyphomicrobiaceae bacterium]|nr:MAG: potassium transporter TrkA [Hyphomicrobiaceae bacterium]